MSPAEPSGFSRLFVSYTALRVWAIIGMGWTALAVSVAVFVLSAVLWEHLTRVEYIHAPPGRPSFPESMESLEAWSLTVPPPGVEVRRRGSGSGGGSGTDRDATPPGAWHTVRLQSDENHAHVQYALRGPVDRATLQAYFDGPFRNLVRESLAAWEPGASVTPLDAPGPPVHFAPSPDAETDVWGVSYTAERAGSVHEGTVVWALASSGRPPARRGDPAEQSYEFVLEASEERWAAR